MGRPPPDTVRLNYPVIAENTFSARLGTYSGELGDIHTPPMSIECFAHRMNLPICCRNLFAMDPRTLTPDDPGELRRCPRHGGRKVALGGTVGEFWPMFLVFGQCWPFVVRTPPNLVNFGSFRPTLTIVGQGWQQLATYCPSSTSVSQYLNKLGRTLAKFGELCQALSNCGHHRPILGEHGRSLTKLGGQSWPNHDTVAHKGQTFAHSESTSQIWSQLGSRGTLRRFGTSWAIAELAGISGGVALHDAWRAICSATFGLQESASPRPPPLQSMNGFIE